MEVQQAAFIFNGAKDCLQQAGAKGRVVPASSPDVQPCKKNITNKLPSTNEVDFAAFWMYFFLYLSFNCVYWIQAT